MWPFKKYRDRLPLIHKKIDSERDLLVFDPTTATHLFSISKLCYLSNMDTVCIDKIQCDYYKSSKGNYVKLIRSLKTNDRIGNVDIFVTTLTQVHDDYVQAFKFADEIRMIYDNYHLPIRYEEV